MKVDSKGHGKVLIIVVFLSCVEVVVMCRFIVTFVFDFHSQTRFIVVLSDWQGF